jgi:hypothetical protein
MHDKNLLLGLLYCRGKTNEIRKENVKISIQFVTSFSSTHFPSFNSSPLPASCSFVCVFATVIPRAVYTYRKFHISRLRKKKKENPSASFLISCFVPNKKYLHLHITLRAIGSDVSSNQCDGESHKSDGSTLLSLIQTVPGHRRFFTLRFCFATVRDVGSSHRILPHVANIDNRPATVLIYKCSLLYNNIRIATHTRNSTTPSLLWYGLVNSALELNLLTEAFSMYISVDALRPTQYRTR